VPNTNFFNWVESVDYFNHMRTCLLTTLIMEYDMLVMYCQHASRRRAAVEAPRDYTGERGETDAHDDRSHL